MKKFASLVLALVMVGAMTLSAMAAFDANGLGSGEQNVTLKVTANDTKVYGVTLNWDMEFAYSHSGLWAPEDLNYGASAGWTDKNGSFTVTNNSNGAIKYSLSEVAAEAGKFNQYTLNYTVNGESKGSSLTDVVVAAASVGNASKSEVSVVLTNPGTPARNGNDDGVIGKITVTIAPTD